MKRQGFTLIELLAVIVILAIIALIATPTILGVIEKARVGAAKASALGYIDAVEKQIMINEVNDSIKLKDGLYTLPIATVDVKGDIPEINSWLVIEKGTVTNYSFKIGEYVVTKDEEVIKSDIIATRPTNIVLNNPRCIRATTLHTEECNRTDSTYYCSGAGYTADNKGTTITYGNLGVNGVEPVSGDAFDCDVNADGIYDSETERFYYVTDLEENSNYSVLIYYNNTMLNNDGNIVENNTYSGTIAYDESNENWHGPRTAIKFLPTINDWKNISLHSSYRNITTQSGSVSTSGGEIENPFEYKDKAARLITMKEINEVCGITISTTIGELDNCIYLMENTRFASTSSQTYGYFLENANIGSGKHIFVLGGGHRMVDTTSVIDTNWSVRPVIEILKDDIEY